jgi:hypothetical protein
MTLTIKINNNHEVGLNTTNHKRMRTTDHDDDEIIGEDELLCIDAFLYFHLTSLRKNAHRIMTMHSCTTSNAPQQLKTKIINVTEHQSY